MDVYVNLNFYFKISFILWMFMFEPGHVKFGELEFSTEIRCYYFLFYIIVSVGYFNRNCWLLFFIFYNSLLHMSIIFYFKLSNIMGARQYRINL